jgi:hypothetical protein
MPIPIPLIAKIAGSLLLPIILDRISGPIADSLDSRIVGKLTSGGAKIMPDGTYKPRINGRLSRRSLPLPTSKVGPVLRGIGGVAGGIATGLGHILPQVMNLGGKMVQTAGVTAGAGAQALGNVPAHLAAMVPDSKRNLYGGTPLDAFGGIASDIGTAVNTGLSSTGMAVGTSVSDAARYFQVMNAQREILKNAGDMMSKYRNLSPAALNFGQQLVRTGGKGGI